MADEESSQNISKFDSTIAVLIRLDLLWKECHKHARRGMLMEWNWDLDRVWMELTADAKPGQREDFYKINEEISKSRGNKEKLYSLLMKKETFLRLIEKEQGKGVGYQEPLQDYIQQ